MDSQPRVETQDGLLLDGLWQTPCGGQGLPDIDACLLVHGTGSHMAAPGVLATFAEQALAAGTPVLRINTRGHGKETQIPTAEGTRPGGAAYESISECVLDLAAWLQWLEQQGMRRVALVGHSMGAVKSIFTAAIAGPVMITRVIAISPPRFCFLAFMGHSDGPQFMADYQRAQEMLDAGRGEELIEVRFPLPLKMTAEGIVEKYSHRDEYDFVRYLHFVKCPLLVLLGSRSVETSMAFYTTPLALRGAGEELSHVTFELIDGADTNYTDCQHLPFERAHAWLTA